VIPVKVLKNFRTRQALPASLLVADVQRRTF